jgi:hypothetical protein
MAAERGKLVSKTLCYFFTIISRVVRNAALIICAFFFNMPIFFFFCTKEQVAETTFEF